MSRKKSRRIGRKTTAVELSAQGLHTTWVHEKHRQHEKSQTGQKMPAVSLVTAGDDLKSGFQFCEVRAEHPQSS
ncbi:MAG: hypothetical protein DMG89_07775 [Acidobacteria bacterium]|nr:MAG: hypothetical protein DMG89_07775 [Acidobacteriota bacterium]